jgi:site-specific DNA-methyltransferase (adenine-specific)
MILSESPKIQAFNIDCMDFMRDKPDNYYDLAIVDPPYGIGDKFKSGINSKMNFKEIPQKGWDVVPNDDFFNELIRVSKNQIIWGGNYFALPPTRCFIVWDKIISDDFSLAMGEYAWTSFDKIAKIYKRSNHGERIHPTQKPVALYRWLLKNYAKEGDKILDTHGGSFSSAIACHMEGFDLDICELDEDYFNDAVKRFKLNTVQEKLF